MIHLVVPGLLWRRESAAAQTRALALPALGALLGRGRRQCHPAVSAERWLCAAFGLRQEEPPCGALRLLGDGGEPGEDVWLCVDPVHVAIGHDTLAIDPTVPDLTADEAAQLIATLNAQLHEFGEFHAPHPQRWYLRTPHLPRILTQPPAAVAGRPLTPFLPQGEEAREWRRFINEAQVLLHHHPVNAARQAAGRRPANSLWPWGAGRLPAAAHAPATGVLADHPLARGLAKHAGVPAAALPQAYDAAVAPGLTFLDALAEAHLRLDDAAWRAGLARLERDWFAPLLAALQRRRLHGLRLTALGEEAVVELTLDAGDAWRLWRRRRTLEELAP